MIPDGRTPVVVVTGFLGSGKTTLVNRLVKGSDSLVIVNELGEVPVDHLLVESSEEKTVALPNGCLCCHLRGDLEEALIGAAMRRRRGDIAGFDRVIVETSGLADPGLVAQTLYADPALARDFKLGPIVAVVDAADAGSRQLSADIARAQIAAADVLVLSKVDRAGDPADTVSAVRALNPTAKCIAAQSAASRSGSTGRCGASCCSGSSRRWSSCAVPTCCASKASFRWNTDLSSYRACATSSTASGKWIAASPRWYSSPTG